MADEVTLLPCPFCGNSVLSWAAIRDDVAVVCDCCGTRGPRKGDLSVARNAWNCRPTDPALAAKDAELARLTAELADKQATIDLFMKCMRRTNRLWREAHPDKPLESPDGAEAFVWLKEQVDALKKRRCVTCHYAWRSDVHPDYWLCTRSGRYWEEVSGNDFCSHYKKRGEAKEEHDA